MSKGTDIYLKDVTVPFIVEVGTPVDIEIPIRGYVDPGSRGGPDGYGSLDIAFDTADSGTLAASILASNGSVFSVPEGYVNFFTAKPDNTDGFFPFQFPICKSIKIRLTATTGAATVTRCIPAIG